MSKTTYYTYDASRRMTRSYPQPGGTEARYYTYNQRDMVTQIQSTIDTNRYFTYNGAGERVVVVDGGGPNYWTYDKGKLLTEKDSADTLVRRYRHNESRQEELGSLLEVNEKIGSITYFLYPVMDQCATVKRLAQPSPSFGEQFFTKYELDAAGSQFGTKVDVGGVVSSERLRFWSHAFQRSTMTFETQLAHLGHIYMPNSVLALPPRPLAIGLVHGRPRCLSGALRGCGPVAFRMSEPPPMGWPHRPRQPDPFDPLDRDCEGPCDGNWRIGFNSPSNDDIIRVVMSFWVDDKTVGGPTAIGGLTVIKGPNDKALPADATGETIRGTEYRPPPNLDREIAAKIEKEVKRRDDLGIVPGGLTEPLFARRVMCEAGCGCALGKTGEEMDDSDRKDEGRTVDISVIADYPDPKHAGGIVRLAFVYRVHYFEKWTRGHCAIDTAWRPLREIF